MHNDHIEQFSVRCPHCRTMIVKDRGMGLQVVACPRCHALFSLPNALKLAEEEKRKI